MPQNDLAGGARGLGSPPTSTALCLKAAPGGFISSALQTAKETLAVGEGSQENKFQAVPMTRNLL